MIAMICYLAIPMQCFTHQFLNHHHQPTAKTAADPVKSSKVLTSADPEAKKKKLNAASGFQWGRGFCLYPRKLTCPPKKGRLL